MLSIMCFSCDTKCKMHEFEIIEVEKGLYHKKWRGNCVLGHASEYVDFTRIYTKEKCGDESFIFVEIEE